MQPETIVAVVVAVAVPWMAFRLALRQDHARWLRERRAELYVDLLTEAYAEQQYFDLDTADADTREAMRPHFVDLRLPPLERARLGARGTAIGSRTVNQLFNRMQSEALSASLVGRRHEGDVLVARVAIGRTVDELHAAIRRELGADSAAVEGPRREHESGGNLR